MKRLLALALISVAMFGFGCTPKTPEAPAKTAPPEAPTNVPLPTRVQPLRDLPDEKSVSEMTDDARAAALVTYMESHDLVSAPALPITSPSGTPEKTGAFQSHHQDVTGGAVITKDGDRFKLILSSDFVTTAGPDLRVVATSNTEPRTSEGAFQAPSADLGRLQGTSGAQIYDLGSLALEDVQAVAIYSDPFQVILGWAPLN
jgi:hypothetical protein